MTLADHYLSTIVRNRKPDQLDYDHLYADHCPDAIYNLGHEFRCPLINSKFKSCAGCWQLPYKDQEIKYPHNIQRRF